MFSPHLFDHKYDIDDLINAFCGSDHAGRWLLNSRSGKTIAETAETNTQTFKDGDDENHWHEITPLPASFLQELLRHPKQNKLNDSEKEILTSHLNQSSQTSDLKTMFDEGRVGGWLRERVKEAVIDWLEMKDMIPPSMRHVRDSNLFGAPPAPSEIKKVKIQ